MQNPITRRAAIRTSGLAALVAGLIGTTTPAPVAAGSPQTLATVVDAGELLAHSLELAAQYRAAVDAQLAASNALGDQFTTEQVDLLRRLDDATGEHYARWGEVVIAEMARHAPGLAPTIWLLWQHAMETRTDDLGHCCTRARIADYPPVS